MDKTLKIKLSINVQMNISCANQVSNVRFQRNKTLIRKLNDIDIKKQYCQE